MPKKPITAADLVRELESDPEWVAQRDRRERRYAALAVECAEDEGELVREIREQGYDIDSVWDLVNNTPHEFLERRFIGSYANAYSVLVAHLDVRHHPRIREGIVRALTVDDGGQEAESALLQAFLAESSPALKWFLANALWTAMSRFRLCNHPEIAAALANSPDEPKPSRFKFEPQHPLLPMK